MENEYNINNYLLLNLKRSGEGLTTRSTWSSRKDDSWKFLKISPRGWRNDLTKCIEFKRRNCKYSYNSNKNNDLISKFFLSIVELGAYMFENVYNNKDISRSNYSTVFGVAEKFTYDDIDDRVAAIENVEERFDKAYNPAIER